MKNTLRNSSIQYSILILVTLLFLGLNPNYSYSQKKEKVVYDETMPEVNGMVKVKKGKYYGFLNSKGKLMIEPQYELASDFDENGFSIVKGSIEISFYELINREGVKVYSGVVRELKYYPQWKRYLARENVFGHVILDEKGKRVPTESYAEIIDINSNGIGTLKMLEKADSYGLVSMKTGMLTKPEYKNIYSEKNGFRTYEKMTNGVMTCGHIDVNGNLLKEVYEDAYDYGADGLAVVKRNGYYGFVDKTEKMITGFDFDDANSMKEGSALVLKKGIPGRVNSKGEYQNIATVKWAEVGGESEGFRWVKLFSKFGFIDKNETLVIPVIYQSCYGFTNGIAGVKKGGKYGYVNSQNKEIIPIKYDYAGKVNDGMILVREDNLFGYYNDKGVLVSKIEFNKAEDFSGGFGNVSIGEKVGKIDKLGKVTWEKETVYTLVDDEAQWAQDEKLKNIIDAKTLASLPSGPATGIQISKNGVSNRKMSYHMSALGSKNGFYFGPATTSGDGSGILFNVDVRDKDKGNITSKLGVHFSCIAKDKSGKYIGIGNEKIQEFDVSETKAILGNFVQVDLDLLNVCVSTNGIVGVLAKGERDLTEPFVSPLDFYLILWDRKNKLVTTFLMHDGAFGSNAKIAASNDGNFVIGFDARPNRLTFRTTYEKIDVNTSLKAGKLKSLWKRTYSIADTYELTDLIIDSEQNIVSAFKSDELDGAFTDKDKTKFYFAELGIVKCNSNGEEFRNYVQKSVAPDLWGRSSDGGKLEMKSQDKMYFSSNENPKIIENPNGPGYIVCTRFSYGLWVWSAKYQTMNTDYKSMYADQPAFAFIDENSLKVTSVDFIETTDGSNAHRYIDYKISNQLGNSWDIDEFHYNSEKSEFVIVENYLKGTYQSQIWTFKMDLIKNWSGDYTAPENSSTSTANSTSTNTTKTNTTAKTSTKCTILNDLKPDQVSKYNDVRLVFDNSALVSKSLSRGQSMEVDCDDVIVHAGVLGSTDSKKVRKLFETKGKCGQTIKLSEFW